MVTLIESSGTIVPPRTAKQTLIHDDGFASSLSQRDWVSNDDTGIC